MEAAQISAVEALLEPIVTEGEVVAGLGDISEARSRRAADLARLDTGVRRLVNPHTYHVSVTRPLLELKQTLVQAHRTG